MSPRVSPTRPPGKRSRPCRATCALAMLALGACGQLVRYTDELVDRSTGRSLLVRTPATFGGVVGFVAGIPFDILGLPISYPMYLAQKDNETMAADPLSTLLFPSFVMWRAGTLVAVPLDAVEYLAHRAWLPPQTPTKEEQERYEVEQDELTLPVYPVRRIFPPGGSVR